jgi:hypothetical protein
MRILAVIPHYCRPGTHAPERSGRHGSESSSSAARARGLSASIAAFHQMFGPKQHVLNIAERRTARLPIPDHLVHVVVCTLANYHVLDELEVDRSMFQHCLVETEPPMLGFACHAVLRDRWGNYDYYCYVEDDLVLRDPWFFRKLDWFSRHVGDQRLLLPNRFERGRSAHLHKLYVDGDLSPGVTAPFQNRDDDRQLASNVMGQAITFWRPLNPHAGCFFLNAAQMQTWINSDHFLNRDISFVGPLESAATLGIMRTFRIYKPAVENADFLEIEHYGAHFLQAVRFADRPDE